MSQVRPDGACGRSSAASGHRPVRRTSNAESDLPLVLRRSLCDEVCGMVNGGAHACAGQAMMLLVLPEQDRSSPTPEDFFNSSAGGLFRHRVSPATAARGAAVADAAPVRHPTDQS